MSFNPSIPNVNDFLAISQKQMLANFQSIFTSFAQDHAQLGSSNQGQHNSLTLRPQSGDPATAINQVALYNKLVSSVPQVFFRPNNNQTPIQLTNSNLNVSNGANQSTFLAGPFTIYTGFKLAIPGDTVITCTPSSTLIYAGVTIINDGTSHPLQINAINLSTNQFTVHFSPAAKASIYYLAIGST